MPRKVFIASLLLLVVVFSALWRWPAPTQGQGNFTTNTPEPAGGFSLVTNTPRPSPTPSLTPSSTPTLTPTFTATFTPSNTPTPTSTPTNTPTPTPTPIGPYFYPEGVNALTGQLYPDQAALERRNLIVKISNFPPVVRPQHGLNQADVIFEYETEGVTRFAAIFRSNAPTRVGSIRSARLLDMELVTMYNALLAYSGTSEPIQELLLNADFRYQLISPSIGDGCEMAGFCRFPQGDRAFEHTLFGDTTKIWETATRRNVNVGLRARGFAFNETPDLGGLPASDVFVDWYGRVQAHWQYDPATGRYLRWTDGRPHYDAADNRQFWTDNIAILEVPHNRRPDLFPAGVNYESIEIALWEQGRAILIRDGQAYQGFWRRRTNDPGEALQIIYGNNVPIMMKPGRTVVELVRGLGFAEISAQPADMAATETLVARTPTVTPNPNVID